MISPESKNFTVKIRKMIRALAERAFDAFTKPDLLSQWFTTQAEVDRRVGEQYRIAES